MLLIPLQDSVKFVQEVHVETSLTKDNSIREAEISFIVGGMYILLHILKLKHIFEFQPPLACEFQTSSYMLTISDGNKTWTSTRDPVAIIDARQPVEVEMESGFLMDTDYLATITVFTEYTNISSSTTFSESIKYGVIMLFTLSLCSQGFKFLPQRTNQVV